MLKHAVRPVDACSSLVRLLVVLVADACGMIIIGFIRRCEIEFSGAGYSGELSDDYYNIIVYNAQFPHPKYTSV